MQLNKKKQKFITLKEAAEIFNYAPDHIGFLIRKEKIPGKKIYSRAKWKVSREAILNYLNRKSQKKGWMDLTIKQLRQEYLSLKEAAKISGYAPDYIGYLIRRGKVSGRKIYSGVAWVTTEKAIKDYQEKREKRKAKISIVPLTPILRKGFYFSLKAPKYGLVFSVLGVIIFSGLIAWAFTSQTQTQTVEIYPTQYEGNWQNPKNVIGTPDVSAEGNIDAFSETNSAVYKSGVLSLAIQNFQETRIERIQKLQQEATGTETIDLTMESQGIQEATTIEESIIESTPTEPTLMETTTEATSVPATEGVGSEQTEVATTSETSETPENSEVATTTEPIQPISLFEKIENIFKNNFIRAQEIPTFKELIKNEFLSAKIKFSFAIGEKKPDILIIKQPATTTESETTSSEPTSFWDKIKNFFTELVIKKASIAKATEEAASETTSSEIIIIPEAKTTINETETTTEPTIIESIPEETTTTGATITQEITTTTEALPDLDAKIIIWYSLDGEIWGQLGMISNYPISNFLNGGYFEYEAPFLKNWGDVKNLKIKFEGVIGGETKFIAYLDNVWIEVNYREIKKVEEKKESSPEENQLSLSAKITTPERTPEIFYLKSLAGIDSTVAEPNPVEFNQIKYVPWRLRQSENKFELEFKSENGIQKIVIEKDKTDYTLWEDRGEGFELKATAIPKFQFKEEKISQGPLSSNFSLIEPVFAQELISEQNSLENLTTTDKNLLNGPQTIPEAESTSMPNSELPPKDGQWQSYQPQLENKNNLTFEKTNDSIILTHSYQLRDGKNNLIPAETIIKIGFNGYQFNNEWIFSLGENSNINRMYWDVILEDKNQIKSDDDNVTEEDIKKLLAERNEGLWDKIKNFVFQWLPAQVQDTPLVEENDKPILEENFGDVKVGWKDFVEQEEKNNPSDENVPKTRAEHIKNANALRVWFQKEGKEGAITIDPTLIIQMPTSKIAVRNFASNNFGATSSGQWYLEFDASWGGMIKTFKAAEVSPFSTIASAANLISPYATIRQPLYDAYLSSDATNFVGNAQATTTEFQLLGNDPERIVVHTKSTHTVATSTLTVDAYHYVYPTGKIYVTWEVTTNFTTYTTATSSCFFRMSETNNASNTAIFYNSYPAGYVGQIYGTSTNPNIRGVTFMPYDATFFSTSTAESNNTTQLRTMVCSGKTSLPAGTYTQKFFVFFGDNQPNVNKTLAANYTHAYRTPDTLTFTTGSVWNDDGDGYNESNGAYTAAFSNQEITFDIDGGTNGTSTTDSVLGPSSTTVSVVYVSDFTATGTAYIIDSGVIDEFSYTGLDGPNNDFTGVIGLSEHTSTGLDVFQPTRYKPGFKIRNWLSADEPYSVTVEGVTKTKWTDYNVGIVQFSEAWFYNYNFPASSTYTQIAAGGSDEIDPREYLDDESPNQNYIFQFDEVGRNQADILYLGAHTKFTGVNTRLRDFGTGSADLEWEYWNGASSTWDHLEVTDSLAGVSDLKASGYLTFSEPADWQKSKVNNGASLYWIRAWLNSGKYTGYPQERYFKTDILNFRYLTNITEAGITISISAGTPPAPGGPYHIVADRARVVKGNVIAGDVTATRYSDGSRFHIATTQDGLDVVFIFQGLKPQSANKFIVYYRGFPQTQALSYQIQICDYVNTSGSSGESCDGGNSVWRNILDHGSSNPDITLNNVSIAGAEETYIRQFHLFNGYFASTTNPNNSLNTPLSNFISNGELLIRFVSNVTAPDLILYIDYIAIETVVDNFYSAGDITVATGTVMAGSYTDTFWQDKAAAASCNPSIPECIWVNNNNGVNLTFKFKNVVTPYSGANAILVTEVGYVTANNYTLSIWNASSSQWEALNAVAYTNTTNNHHAVAKSGINPSDYITGSNEIWIRVYVAATSGNYFGDRISVAIGSTSNSASQGEISLGINSANSATATASLDNSTTTDVYWSASSSLATSTSLSSTMYSDDAIGALTTEHGVAANINLPVTPPNNALVTEVIWAARWGTGAAGLTTSLALSTYSRSWRQQIGDDIINVQTFQMGVYGACSPCTNAAIGAITQSVTNSFQGPLARPFTTAAADAFVNTWMDGPAVALPTSVTAGNGEAVATWESVDPTQNFVNLRIRTRDSTITTQSVLNWDFAFVTIRYWDGVYPTLKSRVTAADGGYVVGTSTVSNWRFTKDDFSAASPFAYSWAATDTGSALDLYLVMATTTLPSSANKLIVTTRAAASVITPDIDFMICDFATSTGTYSSDARCPAPGGWRIITPSRGPYDFSAATTQNYFQFEIYDGYFTTSVASTTPVSTPLSNFFSNGVAKLRVLEIGTTSGLTFYWEFAQLEIVTSNNYFAAGFASTTPATIESGGFTSLYAPDGSGTGACAHSDSVFTNLCHGITSTAGQTLAFYYSFKNVVTPYSGANAIFIDARVNNSSLSANGQIRIYNFTTGLWEVLNSGDLDVAAATLYRFQFIKQVNNWSDYISSGEIRVGYYSAYTTSFTVRFDYLEVYLGSVIIDNTLADITSGSLYDGDPFNTNNLDTTLSGIYTETTNATTSWRVSGYGRNSATFDGATNQASSLRFPMTMPANALPTNLLWIVKAGISASVGTAPSQRMRFRNFSGDFDIAYNPKVTFPAGLATGPLGAGAAGVGGMEVYYFTVAIAANAAPYKGYYITSPERYFNSNDNLVRLQIHTYTGLYTTSALLTWDAAFISMNYISN